MPNNERFVSETAPAGWSVDNRGYIHGGFETPEFLKVKREHNSRLTKAKRTDTMLKKHLTSNPNSLKNFQEKESNA